MQALLAHRLSQRLFNEFIIFHERITPHNRERGVCHAHSDQMRTCVRALLLMQLVMKISRPGREPVQLFGRIAVAVSTMHLYLYSLRRRVRDWLSYDAKAWVQISLCPSSAQRALWIAPKPFECALIPLWWGRRTMRATLSTPKVP